MKTIWTIGLSVQCRRLTRFSLRRRFLRVVSWCAILVALLGISQFAHAQTFADIGAAAPVPAPGSIFQTNTGGNQAIPDGLNFRTDNPAPPGQTFTTGANNVLLTSVSIRTAGLNSGGGFGDPLLTPTYYLRLYSVSGNVASLRQTWGATNPGLTDSHWLQWSNITYPLASNSTYAFGFGIQPSFGGWCTLAVASGNKYLGGEISLIPLNGGPMTLGASHSFDAVFELGLTNTAQLVASPPAVLSTNPVTAGNMFTLAEYPVGSGPFSYRWQTFTGGAFSDVPGGTNAVLNVTVPQAGQVSYRVIVGNFFGSVTGAVSTVTVLPAPGMADVTVNVSAPLQVMPAGAMGAATAVYENTLADPNSTPVQVPLLKAAGIGALRFPSGSSSDIYNWESNSAMPGFNLYTGPTPQQNHFFNFMNNLVIPAGAAAVVTCNYGTDTNGTNAALDFGGDPNLAAAWVAFANVTNHWGVKYWIIGNEVYGNGWSNYAFSGRGWEADMHPDKSPMAYGSNVALFAQAMKAVDPTIQIGVNLVQPGVYPDLDTPYPFNESVLSNCSNSVDFVTFNINAGGSLTPLQARIPSLVQAARRELVQSVGLRGANLPIYDMTFCPPYNGTNSTGTNIYLQTGDFEAALLDNGVGNFGIQELHNDLLLEYPPAPYTNQQPTASYFDSEMVHLLANTGDTMLTATSDQASLKVHAAAREDGNVGICCINLDPSLATTANVTVTGASVSRVGVMYQFGAANFTGTDPIPTSPISTNSIFAAGNQFAITVPPSTMVDIVIPATFSNTPPVLAPISNQIVNAGQTVAFTAVATDTDVPAQTLTFSLLAGPANATLNPTNGAFSWRPLVTQANTSNLFTIQVADNGTPSMSATQSFSVIVNSLVPPSISSVAPTNGHIEFQIGGQFGPDYEVQTSTDLSNWMVAIIFSSPTVPFFWEDTNLDNLPEKFYRVKIGPPLP